MALGWPSFLFRKDAVAVDVVWWFLGRSGLKEELGENVVFGPFVDVWAERSGKDESE